MEISLQKNQEKSGLANLLLIILRRMIALFFLYFTIVYWAKIVGLGSPLSQAFDTMSVHWQVASVLLAVALPTAAIGLWSLFSWGTISWLSVIVINFTMYFAMSDKFGYEQDIVVFHIVCLAVYIALKLYLRVQSRNRNGPR